MNTLPRPHPLLVVILDGWGISFATKGNAIAAANTPTMDLFARHFPTTSLVASGLSVGLPSGVGGNSETGHRNIGAGHVEYQMLAQIDQAIEDASFFDNDALLAAFEHVAENDSSLHLMGMLSRGGVHSHISHLIALLKMIKRRGVERPVYIHLFTDGRDSSPQGALTYLGQLEEAMTKYQIGTIASITGRYFAMDRNNNWERTQAAYDLLVGGTHEASAPSARRVIERAYSSNIGDEMIAPAAITRAGVPVAAISDNDAVIFFNFRPDRARQLTRAFVTPEDVPFSPRPLRNLRFVTLAQFDSRLPAQAAFLETKAAYPLARILSDQGLTQLHIAETEKYAHITYYLNVGHEEPFPGEERVMIASANVSSFADKPEMGAIEITDAVLDALSRNSFDVYFINYANADMVGHTARFSAVVAACSALDAQLARLYQAVEETNGALVVTADHGKAEDLLAEDTYQRKTEHTTNPVPLHYVRPSLKRSVERSAAELAAVWRTPVGVLADVTPTLLDILRIDPRPTMTGTSLLGSLQ